MGEKISTQAMSYEGSDSCFSKLNYYPSIKPFKPSNELTCFTELERDEIKQMMHEVLNEMNIHITPSLYVDKYGTIMERIRDDYHHGGYDQYE